MIFNAIKNKINNKREFKFYSDRLKKRFLNQGYKKFKLDETGFNHLDLPFEIYTKERNKKKYKIYLPEWLKFGLLNSNFLYRWLKVKSKSFLKNLSDPILKEEDINLINSIFKELENIDKD